jgi:formylglycine-generating enzyme required for sulfatase activity
LKDSWDILDIIAKAVIGVAGVLVPAVIAYALHLYDRRQKEAQRRLSHIETVRQFLPQILSGDHRNRWATITLLHYLGEKSLASGVTQWYISRLYTEEDRQEIERIRTDKDPNMADFARNALQSFASGSEVPEQTAPPEAVESNYRFKTTDVIRSNPEVLFRDKGDEKYGRWVISRGEHTLLLPSEFRMGIYLVTNEFFLDFVKDRGYALDAYWANLSPKVRNQFLSRDGSTQGPSTWPSAAGFFSGFDAHPVTGINHYEASAFCRWLQQKHPAPAGWKWCLPTEDIWEFAARTEEGRIYPWGDVFQPGYCNSVESGNRTTSRVNFFPGGRSKFGCFDMAGNVWEFVEANEKDNTCALRGGSFRNHKGELRNYIRLFGVPRDHRPRDFGFRCAQVRS